MVCLNTLFPLALSNDWPLDDKLSKDAINGLPLFCYTGAVHVVSTPEEEKMALKRLKGASVVGFDTETRPSFRKGKSYSPSLVQVAMEDEVFLFHIKELGLSESLCAFFMDPGVLKTGVAILDDMRALAKLYPFEPAGLVDLADVARHHRIAQQGLRGLAAYFLGVRISKGEQCSNWGRAELTPKQISYAATDAWMSLAIYQCMTEKGLLSGSKSGGFA